VVRKLILLPALQPVAFGVSKVQQTRKKERKKKPKKEKKECQLIFFFTLNLFGLFSTQRGNRELEN